MKNQQSKVTVLVAVYNGASSIDHCFLSLVAQSYQSFDIVCIDDASKDATPSRLKVWKKKLGSRLRVIRHDKNLGLTKSLNQGLNIITAPYTARIDADDWWHKEKLAKQIRFLHRHPDYGIIGCNYINVGNANETKVITPKTNREIRHSMVRRNPFAHSCVVFKNDLIKSVGGYDETVPYGQDYDLWLRCLPHTKFHNLQEFLCFRTVGKGISVDKQKEQMWQSVKTQAHYINKYKLSAINYLALAEPLIIVMMPNWILGLKRRLVG